MIKLLKTLIIAIAVTATATTTTAQNVAIKTNLLHLAARYTPNLGVEVALGDKMTLDISGGYNPWNLEGTLKSNKKLAHWLVQPEFRYWLCQHFNGHFFGVHAIGGQYNISGYKIPGLTSKNSRYQGYMVGGGLTYGYQFILGKRWNLETAIGVGYARLNYDQYDCAKCGRIIANDKGRNYFGPTKASISLLFIIR